MERAAPRGPPFLFAYVTTLRRSQSITFAGMTQETSLHFGKLARILVEHVQDAVRDREERTPQTQLA